ncbi:MAG: radical SAM protein [Bacteroidales bacterium]|jgi:wyosine [tRNA(Phe)-imidazoG37] synthetase (radical SAM superfamily)|nr:radical SAM protein [Bacteroidales bacterium]ODT55813.1 MAG: radical SAM protein [Paludibacter sp. SCN 50-10]OJX91105.1 MAG: radical SAM protein [Paludibacter sp. 47-17]
MILFDEIIFGPVKSRRLGNSLGINLLPTDAKICSFDCIYCECGFNTTVKESRLPHRREVQKALEKKLVELSEAGNSLDVITFAGNGEPTLHPQFEPIIADTIALRNKYFPDAKVSVLSNSTRIHKPHIMRALRQVDNNILKLDSAIEETVRRLDRPTGRLFSVPWLLEQLKKFEGNLIIQTMFLRGKHDGAVIDNTKEVELNAWLSALEEIRPKQVMIYTIDRETPVQGLEKIGFDELKKIAERVEAMGISTVVSG